MSNPFLNDKAIAAAATQEGWAAPDADARSTTISTPIDDGPISTWHPGVMTAKGTATATGVLMVILLAAAVAGWQAGPDRSATDTGFTGLAIGAVLVGFACAIAVNFKPMLSKVLGPIYAIAQGFFLGVISKSYNNYQNGIVLQAVGATLGVFLVMLFLYRTRILKVTDKFKRTVITATMGLMLFYLVAFVISIFGGGVSFLQSTSLLGIGFSVFAAGLASMMLAVDFDFIDKGAQQQLPKGMEWYAAFGLLITIVWLYLELLRLLSKLNSR